MQVEADAVTDDQTILTTAPVVSTGRISLKIWEKAHCQRWQKYLEHLL